MTTTYPSLRTRVKICGITRTIDARAVAELGADALGLVFYRKSPRHVTIDRAQEIVAVATPFVKIVGLFVDAAPAEVQAVLAQVPLDLLQFHGDEAPDYCESFGRPYIKAIRVRSSRDAEAGVAAHSKASGFLFDAWHRELKGGTGECFDWNLIPEARPQPLILAGGLDAGNVSAALRAVRPYAVDVSSGVEAEAGIKDVGKITAFIEQIHRFDQRQNVD